MSRLIFVVAGVDFEDVRIPDDKWQSLKPKMPFGMLPILEVDGQVICQSKAIARFLAHRFGLVGKTDMENVRLDMIVECLEDSNAPIVKMFLEPDLTKRAALKKMYAEVQMPEHYRNLENMLKANKGGDGFFIGDKLTWADLYFIHICTRAPIHNIHLDWSKYPKLKALRKRVESIPKIAAHIAQMPDTPF